MSLVTFEVYPYFSFEDQFNKIVTYFIHDLNNYTLSTSVLILYLLDSCLQALNLVSLILYSLLQLFNLLDELTCLRIQDFIYCLPDPKSNFLFTVYPSLRIGLHELLSQGTS